jgi:hypothetical protein
MSSPDTADTPTVAPVHLGASTADLVSLFGLAPLIGLGVGLTLPWVATWADHLRCRAAQPRPRRTRTRDPAVLAAPAVNVSAVAARTTATSP